MRTPLHTVLVQAGWPAVVTVRGAQPLPAEVYFEAQYLSLPSVLTLAADQPYVLEYDRAEGANKLSSTPNEDVVAVSGAWSLLRMRTR